MCRKERMLGTAIKEVDLSKNRHNLVAILEKGGKVLSIGTNDMEKTHPAYFNGEYDKCVHAEYDALRKVSESDGANMYVFYFKKAGGLGDSQPCPDCYEKIKDNGVKKLFYIKDGEFIRETLYNTGN